jgi:hypothetical protein
MIKHAVVATALLLATAIAAPAVAGDARKGYCRDCPAPRAKYDSREVVRSSRDIDHSRVVETQSVVPVRPRVVNKNHLVVHKHQTRHVGVVRHKHTIVEKEVRYVRRAAPRTEVNYVVHDYRTVRRPWRGTRRPAEYRPAPDCIYGKDGRCSDPALDVRG